MHARQQLNVAPGRRLSFQFFADIRINTFQAERIVFQKPFQIILVLIGSDRTRAVDQHSVWPHIFLHYRKNSSLQADNILLPLFLTSYI